MGLLKLLVVQMLVSPVSLCQPGYQGFPRSSSTNFITLAPLTFRWEEVKGHMDGRLREGMLIQFFRPFQFGQSFSFMVIVFGMPIFA